MRRLFFAILTSLIFVACGGDSSTSANDATSSDSAGSSGATAESSSSGKANWAYLNPAISYGEFTDSRDKQVYKTVKIGPQTWMAENLNYAVDSSWCYENSADSCAKYGRLYTWTGAMAVDSLYNNAILGDSVNHQGACPVGWHVPRGSEWDVLAVAVGGILDDRVYYSAGAKLMSLTGWADYDGARGYGTDDYGFSALPAGYRGYYGDFRYVRYYAFFWSATEYNEDYANSRYLVYNYAYMGTYYDDKNNAFSVRCVQDF